MEFTDPVIALHDIARQIEREYGREDIGMDIRRIADRVNELENYTVEESTRRLTEDSHIDVNKLTSNGEDA